MSESNLSEIRSSEIVLAGGRVIDETGERVADVRVVDGLVAEVGPRLGVSAGGLVLDAEGCRSRPVSSTYKCTSTIPATKTPRRSRPRPRAAALGGCTAVICMPNTDPPLDRPRPLCNRCSNTGRGRPAQSTSPVASRRVVEAKSLRRWGSSTTSVCGCSPTTATAWPMHASSARCLRVPRRASGFGPRATRRGSHAGPRWSHARGRLVGAARHPRSSHGRRIFDRGA